MREINVCCITDAVKRLVVKMNYELSEDTVKVIKDATEKETFPVAKQTLECIVENLRAAKEDTVPICQDTGMAVVFAEIGQDVHLVGGDFESAVNKGVADGYTEGFLRKSVVGDPFDRVNTGDNTPAVIYTKIVPGDKVKLTVTCKGFGSENMSKIYMLKPADGADGVRRAVVDAVKSAGPNCCPPVAVGVGVGGTFEKCALMAKHALTRPLGEHSENPIAAELEKDILSELNGLDIGPAGFGGKTTALGVNIETYPTHIAGLPCAVNICCHVSRHGEEIV